MSVTMNRAEGVTVFTLTSDPQSVCPPLCQILRGLCYNPLCCSVSQQLRRVQRSSQSVLGALHFLVGLLHIGLGAILCLSYGASTWYMDETLFPLWFGGVFLLLGSMCIVSEKCPSPCLVAINVILNLAGVGVAIAAIVLYSFNIADMTVWWMCNKDYDYDYYGQDKHTTTTPSAAEERMKEKCLRAKELFLLLARGINSVLIILSVLELCLTISSSVLGIKALRRRVKGESKEIGGPELYNPLLEEVTSNPAA